MNLDTGALIWLVGLVAGAGAALARLSFQAAQIKRLEAGAQQQGERLGQLEGDIKALRRELEVTEQISRPYRPKGGGE